MPSRQTDGGKKTKIDSVQKSSLINFMSNFVGIIETDGRTQLLMKMLERI